MLNRDYVNSLSQFFVARYSRMLNRNPGCYSTLHFLLESRAANALYLFETDEARHFIFRTLSNHDRS